MAWAPWISAAAVPLIVMVILFTVAVLAGVSAWCVDVCTRLATPGQSVFLSKEEALRETLYQRRISPRQPVSLRLVHRRDFQTAETAKLHKTL
eukprot:SAG31_NODE_12955_length_904_cov_1.592547_2_plen_93_part_00